MTKTIVNNNRCIISVTIVDDSVTIVGDFPPVSHEGLGPIAENDGAPPPPIAESEQSKAAEKDDAVPRPTVESKQPKLSTTQGPPVSGRACSIYPCWGTTFPRRGRTHRRRWRLPVRCSGVTWQKRRPEARDRCLGVRVGYMGTSMSEHMHAWHSDVCQEMIPAQHPC